MKRNVRKKCLACQGPSKKKVSNKESNTTDEKEEEDDDKTKGTTAATNKRTYGLSVWEFFVILLEEKDKDLFYTYLRAFRDNLKRYELHTLSAYFEEFYFPLHRSVTQTLPERNPPPNSTLDHPQPGSNSGHDGTDYCSHNTSSQVFR